MNDSRQIPPDPDSVGREMNKLAGAFFFQQARHMDAEARARAVAVYMSATAGWLAAVAGVDNSLAVLDWMRASINAARDEYDKITQGVH